MIVELITPLMIATAPITLQQVEPLKYSHEQQKVEMQSMQLAQYQQRTFGGTRTYDATGRPFDNDND